MALSPERRCSVLIVVTGLRQQRSPKEIRSLRGIHRHLGTRDPHSIRRRPRRPPGRNPAGLTVMGSPTMPVILSNPTSLPSRTSNLNGPVISSRRTLLILMLPSQATTQVTQLRPPGSSLPLHLRMSHRSHGRPRHPPLSRTSDVTTPHRSRPIGTARSAY